MIWLTLWLGCGMVLSQLDNPANSEEPQLQIFEVPKGSTARGLGPSLESAGLVHSATRWDAYLRLSGDGGCLKAGRFELSPSMAPSTIVETLCGSPLPEDVPFTVVEGWRMREIDAALTERGWIQAGSYQAAAEDPSRFQLPGDLKGLKNLEGLLWPETYGVIPDRFTVEDFIQRQLDSFQREFLDKHPDAGSERGLYPLIIMASMLEREEPKPEQRAMVAGILWKRLDNDWNLGVDATSHYSLANWNDRKGLLRNLRDAKDPFNTRKNPGMPPTPIGSPSLPSLEAAMSPEESPYWYYLHDSSGTIRPAKSLKGHEANRKKYNVY